MLYVLLSEYGEKQEEIITTVSHLIFLEADLTVVFPFRKSEDAILLMTSSFRIFSCDWLKRHPISISFKGISELTINEYRGAFLFPFFSAYYSLH